MDGSIVFARCHQCAPHLIHASLYPPESTSQTWSQSVQPFSHSSQQEVPIHDNGPPLSPVNCPFVWGSGPHLIHGSLGLSKSITQMASQSVQPLAGLTIVTDHDTPSVTIGCIYVCSTAMWPNNADDDIQFPQIDIIVAIMIVWRVRQKIIRFVLCSIVCNNCAQCNAHTHEQFICVRLSFLGLFCVIVYLGEEMYGIWGGGLQTKRQTKEDMERGCAKRLPST